MMVHIYIIFDNNLLLIQDLNIQSDKRELLKVYHSGLNILYLTEIAFD